MAGKLSPFGFRGTKNKLKIWEEKSSFLLIKKNILSNRLNKILTTFEEMFSAAIIF